MRFNSAVENLQYSLIRVLKDEATKYPNSIDLTIGEPDLVTPKGIVDKVMEYGRNHQLKYALSGGGGEIGGLVAKHYNKIYGGNYTEKNVIMNIGASEALSSALRTILNPEDEVILTAPYYPGYPPMINLCYAKPVFIDITENNFKLSKELLEKYVTEKTKVILISNPCNPTGNVMGYDEMKEIVDFIKEREIFLVADEIYSALSFYEFHSFAEFRGIEDKLIIVNGFSKSHSMTGWRMGYTICPEQYRRYFLNTSFYTVSSPMSLSLKGAEIALKEYEDRQDLVEEYKKRAEFMSQELEKLGFKVVKPKGAFYIFADYSKLSSLKSLDFSLDLLRKTEVAVVPGISFGVENFIRIALTVDISILKQAIERIKKYS